MLFMVIKRDGIKEEFNRNKIRDAVLKAFGIAQNFSKTMDEDVYRAVTEITNSVVETEDQSIEDIQDQIEELLMDLGYHDVAKNIFYIVKNVKILEIMLLGILNLFIIL